MIVVPVPDQPDPLRLPRFTTARLDNGVVVVAGRRGEVPMAELRLWLPAPGRTAADKAGARLLAKTLLAGTGARSDLDIDGAVQAAGGTLNVSSSSDGLSVTASALTARLGDLLAVVADVLTDAAFPTDRVRNHRLRLQRELVIQRSRPATVASEALAAAMYGKHPYGVQLPSPAALDRIGPTALTRLAAAAVRPGKATLNVVSSLRPGAAIAAVDRALGGWRGLPAGAPLPAPRPAAPQRVRVVHRPGAVQTNIRMGGPALARHEDGYAALALAELALGGYFASRLVANLREEKGYTYSPRSAISHRALASRVTIAADVATDVTGPAFLETRYELGRMATDPPGGDELERARRYRLGGLVLGAQTQAGLAGQLHRLAAVGLGPHWLRDYQAAVEGTSPAEVAAAARRWLRSGDLVTVMVGDAERIVPQLEPLADVEVAAP